MALAVTGAGGLALLGGVVVLGHVVGSYDLDTVLAAGEATLLLGAYIAMFQNDYSTVSHLGLSSARRVSIRARSTRRW
jgi:NADH:ubiquinone oxidoreductase subunit 5 (subunit L)/multisubunit Na+/H+ antiporter MnhA subunit